LTSEKGDHHHRPFSLVRGDAYKIGFKTKQNAFHILCSIPRKSSPEKAPPKRSSSSEGSEGMLEGAAEGADARAPITPDFTSAS